MKILEYLAGILGLFGGLVLVDTDHLVGFPVFHWMFSVMFFLFLGIGLIIFKGKDK